MTRDWERLTKRLRQEVDKQERVVLTSKVPKKYSGFAETGALGFTTNDGTVYILTHRVKEHKENIDEVLAHELAHRVLAHKQRQEEGPLKEEPISKIIRSAPVSLRHEVEANILLHKTYGFPSAKDFRGELGGWINEWYTVGHVPAGNLLAAVKTEALDNRDVPGEWKDQVKAKIEHLIRRLAIRTGYSASYVRRILMCGRTPRGEINELIKYIWYGMPIMDPSETPRGRAAAARRKSRAKRRPHKVQASLKGVRC